MKRYKKLFYIFLITTLVSILFNFLLYRRVQSIQAESFVLLEDVKDLTSNKNILGIVQTFVDFANRSVFQSLKSSAYVDVEFRGGGGGGGSGTSARLYCVRSCRRDCGNDTSSQCYKDCRGDCRSTTSY